MAVTTLPIYLRVGKVAERQIATIELAPHSGDGTVELESSQVIAAVIDALRATADELETLSSGESGTP